MLAFKLYFHDWWYGTMDNDRCFSVLFVCSNVAGWDLIALCEAGRCPSSWVNVYGGEVLVGSNLDARIII